MRPVVEVVSQIRRLTTLERMPFTMTTFTTMLAATWMSLDAQPKRGLMTMTSSREVMQLMRQRI